MYAQSKTTSLFSSSDSSPSQKDQRFTQVPNTVIDEWMPRLSSPEFKLLMAICRKTFGWQKPEGDHVSRSQLQNLTGLSNGGVKKAILGLERAGAISVSRKQISGNRAAVNFYSVNPVPPEPVLKECLEGAYYAHTLGAQNAQTKDTPDKYKETSFLREPQAPKVIKEKPSTYQQELLEKLKAMEREEPDKKKIDMMITSNQKEKKAHKGKVPFGLNVSKPEFVLGLSIDREFPVPEPMREMCWCYFQAKKDTPEYQKVRHPTVYVAQASFWGKVERWHEEQIRGRR